MTEKKGKGGRPPFEPTDQQRQQVMTMAALGLDVKQIALVIGIADKTLTKYFREELDTGVAKITAKVAGKLLQEAMGTEPKVVDGVMIPGRAPNLTAMIFFLKCKSGWRDGSFGSDLGGGGVKAVTFHISEADSRL